MPRPAPDGPLAQRPAPPQERAVADEPGLLERHSPAHLRDLVRRAALEHDATLDDGDVDRAAESLERLCDGRRPLLDLLLAQGPDAWEGERLAALTGPGGAVRRWVETQLIPTLSPAARDLLRLLRDLHPAPPELAGHDPARPELGPAWDELSDAGALCTRHGEPRLVPLLARATPAAPDGATTWWAGAVRWYLDRDHHGPALRAARYADDAATCAAILTEHGERLILTGWGPELVEAVAGLPSACVGVRQRILYGHALRLAGRPAEADRALESVLADLTAWGERPPADLIWRLAAVKYGAGSYPAARELCTGARVAIPADEPPRDRAMRLATLAVAEWAGGDDDLCARLAAEALAAAGVHDDEARVTALLAQSCVLTGARRLNAQSAALAIAEERGFVHLAQRCLVNLADTRLVGADYAEARDAAERALDLIDRTGPAGCYSSGLHNLAEALTGLGELDEARLWFLRGLAVARGRGLERTPSALGGLAEIEYQHGRLEDARAGFEEAAELAREVGDRQALVPALARLATIAATEPRGPDDLDRARALAEEALATASDNDRPECLTALGWVALAEGDDAGAAELAEQACAEARATGSRRGLGPALELAAASAEDVQEAGASLLVALATYQRSGAVVAADRAQLALTRLPGTRGGRSALARAAERRQRRLGIVDRPIHPRGLVSGDGLEIRVLGGFEVRRGGTAVPLAAWRSRQARTLVKLLVARAGRPVAREELCELLWPDDDPAKTGHRLSVLLSTVRGVLDPDKERPTEAYVVADGQGIRLLLDAVHLDLLDFLDDAAEAARLAESGGEDQARQLLTELVAGYRGEAFEDDPYEAWAADVRDQVRSTWIQALRLAARLAGKAGDIDGAVTLLVQLLAADPYDEPAHRLLVSVLTRARRYGEARRAFERWTRAMAEIGAHAPDPELLAQPSTAG